MQKHFIFITLLLLCLMFPRLADAKLMLGVVQGAHETAGAVTLAQANSLASLLTEKLQEDVVVKELSDSATLVSWLDRFAMLDLALLSSKDVESYSGKFLLAGPLDEQGQMNLVIRQGIEGDLPQKLAVILRESGLEPWRKAAAVDVLTKQSQVPTPDELESIVTDKQTDFQHVPPTGTGRTRIPQKDSTYRDVIPVSDKQALKKLVLGVLPDPGVSLLSLQQAEQLALYLEQILPVSVKVKEFTDPVTFKEWFMRYRMVDLAMLSPSLAKINLGKDYVPVAKFFRTDKSGAELSELFVMRHGQNEEMQTPLQQALLDMMQAPDGRILLEEFNISEVVAPGDVFEKRAIVERALEDGEKVEKTLRDLTVEPVEEQLSPSVKYPEPTQPTAPAEVVGRQTPVLPEPIEPYVVLPVFEGIEVTKPLPELVPSLVEPVRPDIIQEIEIPDTASQEGLLQPDIPPLPDGVDSIELPELAGITEPAAVMPLIDQPDVVSSLPGLAVPPAEPVSAVLPEEVDTPALPTQHSEPFRSEIPSLPESLPTVPSQPVSPVLSDAPEALGNQTELSEPQRPDVLLPPEIIEPVPVLVDETTPEAYPETELSEAAAISEDAATSELSLPLIEAEIESELVTSEEPFDYEQQEMLKDASRFADAATANKLADVQPVIIDETIEEWSDEELAAVLGEDLVAAVVSQPDIPHELRPTGVPVVRPRRTTRTTTAAEDELLVASLPEPLKIVEPPRPPNLLPEPDPDPGIVYVVPFVAVMVPDEVNARVFDQFVDTLNQEGESLDLQFVILKDGLQRTSQEWLSARKYVTGEIYAYVEDSGCCSTDLRTKARLVYRRPNQKGPTFGFEYPVKRFFDHDVSTIDVERVKLADDIAGTLSTELLKALKN